MFPNRFQFKDKIDILIDIKEKIGEQKIDIMVKSEREANRDYFIQEIMRKRRSFRRLMYIHIKILWTFPLT